MMTVTGAARPPRFAFAALIGANTILAFGPTLVRLADVGPVAAAFWRLFLAVPFLIFFARYRQQSFGAVPRWAWGLFLVAGLFFAADLGSWHAGIVRTKIANATLFGNVSSLLLPLWGIIFLRQRPGWAPAAAMLLAAAGTALLMGASYEASPRYLTGDLLCIAAGIFYTAYILVMQRVRQTVGSWVSLAAMSAAGALPLLLAALAFGERVIPGNWTPVVILALSSQVIGQGLLIYVLVWFTPLVLGLTLLIQPVVGALLGWLVFGELLSLTDMVGAVAIAAALILVRLPQRP